MKLATLTKISYFSYDPQPLIDARKAQGKSPELIAEEIGIHGATIRRVEAGKKGSYDIVKALCAHYGLDFDKVVWNMPDRGEVRGRKKTISRQCA